MGLPPIRWGGGGGLTGLHPLPIPILPLTLGMGASKSPRNPYGTAGAGVGAWGALLSVKAEEEGGGEETPHEGKGVGE